MVLVAGIAVSAAAALRFTDSSCSEPGGASVRVCPGGVLGSAYAFKLEGDGGNGPPYTFILKGGSLPPGLSLSNTGLISGTPTHAGTSTFGVELQDTPGKEPGLPNWCVTRNTCAWREFSISVEPRVLVTTESAGPGTIASPYTLNLTAVMKSGPDATSPPSSPLTWTLVQGQLPAGLTLNSGTGVISGTPTAEGSSSFVVRAALVDGRADTKGLTINVRQPLAIQASKPFASTSAGALTLWEVSVPFSAKLIPSGGAGTYTFTLQAGTLPTGLALAADGTVSGTPKAAGIFRATIRLADTEGRTLDYAANFGVAQKLAISTLLLRPGKVGRLYRAKLATTGGLPPKKWRVASGPLPRGIRLDRTLGVLSGTPTRPGRYRVTFEAVDALGVKASKTLVINVLA